MAQIVTITNPLTGQPAQVDQLEHTAQEIDDVIYQVLGGGSVGSEKLLALAAAAAYSTSQTYALGAYCTREGKLYRCTTAITTAETWTADHWTETTVGSELLSIYKALQDTVSAKAVSSASVSLTAADLQSYLNAMPRLLTKHITINVTGTLDSSVNIDRFYGSGSITIRGTGGFNMNNGLAINYCQIPVTLVDTSFNAPDGWNSNSQLLTIYGSVVNVQNCSFAGVGTAIAVRIGNGALCTLSGCSISGFTTAVQSSTTSILTVQGSGESNFSNNTYGAYTYRGGIIVFGTSSVPDLLGGASNIKAGGAIIKNGAFL